MKSRGFLIIVVGLAALLVGGVSVLLYDRSRDDLVAEGVSVAGVDIGGMRDDEARAALERELVGPLRRPIRVRVGEHRFQLTAREARTTVDVDGMVEEAIDRGRSGGLLKRTVRALTGDEVDADVAPRVAWSSEAVGRVVSRVKNRVNRAARDAKVRFTPSSPVPVPGRNGREVNAKKLRADIEALLRGAGPERTLHASVRTVKPKVTTEQLAERYPYVIVVNRGGFRLHFYKGLKLAKTYRIAVGQVGLETPAGLYHVQNKAINPAWHVPNSEWAGKLAGKVIPGGTPENPLKARWMGIYNGAGIHGTDAVNSLGTAASHGCIRMAIPDVMELYDQVPVQTPVYIA